MLMCVWHFSTVALHRRLIASVWASRHFYETVTSDIVSHHSITCACHSWAHCSHHSSLTHSINPQQIYSHVSLGTEHPSWYTVNLEEDCPNPLSQIGLLSWGLSRTERDFSGGGTDSVIACWSSSKSDSSVGAYSGQISVLSSASIGYNWLKKEGSDLQVESSLKMWTHLKVTGRRIISRELESDSCNY